MIKVDAIYDHVMVDGQFYPILGYLRSFTVEHEDKNAKTIKEKQQ
ncbi:MAG: hypothetical protein QXQ46_04400 [Thermoplasmatales archaeon]